MERFGGSWNPFFIEKTTFLRGERNFRETFEKEREFQDRERKRVIPFAIFYEFKFAVSQDTRIRAVFQAFRVSSSFWGKMVTRQCNRKGMYPTRDALKSYEGSVFHLPGAGHREFHHFPRSYQVMSIERGAQYRPSTPYYRSNGYTRIFWYPSLSIISPFFIIFIFPPFFSTVSTLYMLSWKYRYEWK